MLIVILQENVFVFEKMHDGGFGSEEQEIVS